LNMTTTQSVESFVLLSSIMSALLSQRLVFSAMKPWR
jgi:hypothetical protein